MLTLGSRFENSIRPEDADFLMRAAGQLAIAIENHLAYGEVVELKDKLAQEKLYLEDEIRSELDFEGIVGAKFGSAPYFESGGDRGSQRFDCSTSHRHGQGINCARHP